MAQRFLDLQTQTPGLSPRREELYFPQGQTDGGERALCPFPPHPLPGEERRGPGQNADSGAWSADNSLLSNTMDCWPEPYLKASSRESVIAEADQTEDGTTASCSQHEDEAHTLVSEADSWNGLRWLGARAESWADTAKENAPNTVPPASKRPKGRTTFSGEQLRVLQQRFHLQRYVSASERQELGHALGMSSQQVKTWFQNRRMKVKRTVKEPADSPVVSYLRPDSTQGNPLAFRNLTEYMQHQFHPLPKHMVTSSAQAWPCPESMCPALGSLQSTVIKSALHYTNRSVKFSIALSSQPDTEQGPQSVSSSSPSSPEQQFLMPHAFPQHGALQSGHLHPGASGAGLHHGAPQPGLHHGAGLHHGGPQSGHLHPRVSGNGLQHRAPGTGLHHGAGLQHRAPGAGLHYGAGLHHEAPQFGYLHHGASGNGLHHGASGNGLHHGATGTGHLHPGATGTGHLHPGALHQGLPQPEAQSCVLMRYQAAESGGLREGRGFS